MIARMATDPVADSPQISPLSDEEQEWLTQRLTSAQEAGLLADPQALADSFDASREEFLARPEHERGDAAKLVNIYSVAFGEHFSRAYGLQWCVLESGGTAEIGLVDATTGTVLIPLATVSRRWEDADQRPMADLITQTQASLASAGVNPVS